MKMKTEVNHAGTEAVLQTSPSPHEAATSRPSQTTNRSFRVYAAVDLQASAEVVVEAKSPEEAAHRAETALRGNTFTEQVHKILERHELRVQLPPNQSVKVLLESLLLDLPPEATVWKMTVLQA
jgi:hypothetical protein